MKRGIIKKIKFPDSKRSQEVMGMSFGVIFSIILIVFILVIGFISIRAFLNSQKCAQIGIFIDDFQEDIKKTWNSQKDEHEFASSLPTNIEYVCFADFSKDMEASGKEKEIWKEISIYRGSDANLFFYPRENSCDMPYHTIKYLNIEKITKEKNPYCFAVDNGYIIIKIEKDFDEKLVGIK